MITITLDEREAAALFDEVTYAQLPHCAGLNRYEKTLSRMAGHVKEQLADQGVEGIMAASERARF